MYARKRPDIFIIIAGIQVLQVYDQPCQFVDFDSALAVTATGRATEARVVERERLAGIYLEKHTNLVDFVNSQDSALIRIDVTEYVISGFTDVWKLQPE